MGVRPSISVIIGINDARDNDPRFSQPLFDIWDTVSPMRFSDGSWCEAGLQKKMIGDVLYDDVKGIVGYVLGHGGEEIAYALRVCFPEIFESDHGYGYRIFPQRELRFGERRTLETQISHDRDSLDDINFCLEHQCLYEYSPAYYGRVEFEQAKKTLALAGWNVEYSDLKKMLVWNWR